MSANTKIEWCDATVNWWAGCMKVSPACDNCYAERMAGRLWGTQWGPTTPRHQFQGPAEALRALDRKAARLGRPLKVFHNSLSDMFDTAVPDGWRMAAFQCMADTPNLIHLVLTKRIGNVRPYTQRDGLAFDLIGDGRVWLGISICNQPEADRDIPKLLAVPAAKRFLSMGPLLGPVDLPFDRLREWNRLALLHQQPHAAAHIDWVIVGGESGPNARPMHPNWARSLRDQCEVAGVPFLFKQWGEWAPDWEGAMTCTVCERTKAEAAHTKRGTPGGEGECDECGVCGSVNWDAAEQPLDSLRRIGKKAAGRLLDGRTWDGVPS